MSSAAVTIISVALWVFIAVASVAGIIQDYRKRQLALEPLRLAIEHGQQLDPDLLQLFDETREQTRLANTQAFLAETARRMERETKMRLMRRCALAAVLLSAGAIAAPYVAGITLAAAGVASISPLCCACAALIAWRIARRAYRT